MWGTRRVSFFLLLATGAIAREDNPRPLMKDFIGINGHTIQFKPDLYRPVCGLVRDYHPVEWDLADDSSSLPEFPFAKNRVDWSKVYGSWHERGWTTNACLMFESMKRESWKDVPRDAKRYGEAFAREFGPGGTRKLVESVEIGNEPGKWSDEDYSTMFRSMAEGIRSGDASMKIATCNLTTGKSGDYEKSVECIASMTGLVDILTIHSYAQLEGWPTWKRSFPEDPALPRYLKDVADLCAWRDAHAPGKPVWITEFGYDSTTRKNETSGDFVKWQGVTDEQQAQWLVRSLLVFSSMPVERAYTYFFNDSDQPSLHASAGITRHFQPKPSFHALTHLQKTLGNFRFKRIVKNEAGRIRIHEYEGDDGGTIWAIWSPTGERKSALVSLDPLPGIPKDISIMPLTGETPDRIPLPEEKAGTIELQVGESPLYLRFGR